MNCINKTSRLVGLCLVGALLLVITAGCGKSQQQPQQENVVKGFYIGMTATDVLKTCEDLYGWTLTNNVVVGTDEIEADVYEAPNYASVRFILDSNRKLKILLMGGQMVDILFSSHNMNSEEFAQKFVKAYNIKQMKKRVTPKGSLVWESTSSDGIVVTIFEDKTLEMRKVDMQEVNGNFN
jgi:hypothetical protein